MSDRELLEFAAKAADIFLTPETLARALPKWKWDKDFEPRHEGELGMSGAVLVYDYDGKLSGTTREAWNPITDDGDALQLMVRLRLEPRFLDNSHSNGAEPSRVTLHNVAGIVENIDDDPLAAARRAIVRAAAEIGRQMS